MPALGLLRNVLLKSMLSSIFKRGIWLAGCTDTSQSETILKNISCLICALPRQRLATPESAREKHTQMDQAYNRSTSRTLDRHRHIPNSYKAVERDFFERETFLLQRNTNHNTDKIQQHTHTWLSPCKGDGHHLVYESLYHLHFKKQQNMWNRNRCSKVQNNGKHTILENNQFKLKEI